MTNVFIFINSIRTFGKNNLLSFSSSGVFIDTVLKEKKNLTFDVGFGLIVAATNLDTSSLGDFVNVYSVDGTLKKFWKYEDGYNCWNVFLMSNNELLLYSIRSFKTNNAPAIMLSSPLNSITGIAIPVDFSWTPTDADVEDAGALTYELYLDTNQNPVTKIASPTVMSFDVSALIFVCKYYWKVVASDGKDKSTIPIWAIYHRKPRKDNFPKE